MDCSEKITNGTPSYHSLSGTSISIHCHVSFHFIGNNFGDKSTFTWHPLLSTVQAKTRLTNFQICFTNTSGFLKLWCHSDMPWRILFVCFLLGILMEYILILHLLKICMYSFFCKLFVFIIDWCLVIDSINDSCFVSSVACIHWNTLSYEYCI